MENIIRTSKDNILINTIAMLPFNEFEIEVRRHSHLLNFKRRNFDFASKFTETLRKGSEVQMKKAIIHILLSNDKDTPITEWCNEKGFLYKHCLALVATASNLRVSYVIYFKKIAPQQKKTETYFEQSVMFLNMPSNKEDIYPPLKAFLADNSQSNLGLSFDVSKLSQQCGIDLITRTDGCFLSQTTNSTKTNQEYTIMVKNLGQVNRTGFDLSIWDETEEHRIVCKRLQQKKTLSYDSIIKENAIDCFPSKQEKELINTSDNIIVSGRPGTGKTFIVVFKCVLLFYNCHILHCKLLHNTVNWDLIKEQVHDLLLPKEQYKIVVTSLSQTLCSKAEEMFSHLISKTNSSVQHYPLSKHIRENMRCFKDVLTNYPLFINFRKILFMIDGSINSHFFSRKINNQIMKQHDDCDMRYYSNCIYRCANGVEKKEVNEDDFISNPYFTNIIRKDKRINNKHLGGVISPMEVYSQIISIIKGSAFSYLGENNRNGISREQYHQIGRKLAMLNDTQRDAAYDIFLLYEKWKGNQYFDIQDVVNHLIRQVTHELVPHNRKLIDYLLIDEVQDFSISQLYLMTLITKDIKIATGDTCQTISKVNRFRFCDLSGIYFALNQIDSETFIPSRIQINLNFRCHSKVIKLSHFFFQLIFLLFPETLDKAKLDYTTAKVNPVTPCVIGDISDLNALIDQKESSSQSERDNYNFAFHHCFICYANDTADKLKKFHYKKILTSSIFDSKGLEFDIVVLFNLFSDQNNSEEWNYILSQIDFKETKNDLTELKAKLDEEPLTKREKEDILADMSTGFKPFFIKYFDNEKLHSLFSFCYKLKELYVAITRARKFVFIYEKETPKIFSVLHEKKLISYDSRETIRNAIDFLKEDKRSFEELRKEAEAEFAFHHYKKAEYYFDILGDEDMKQISQIHLLYEEIQAQLNDNTSRDSYPFIRANRSLIALCESSSSFNDPECLKGEALLNLNQYENAYHYFKDKGNNKKCGMVCLKLKRYEEAFDLFIAIRDYSFAFESLLLLKDYTKLFNYINTDILDKTDLLNYTQFYALYSNDYIIQFQFKRNKLKAVKAPKQTQQQHFTHFNLYGKLDMYYDENQIESRKEMFTMITETSKWNLTQYQGVGIFDSNRLNELSETMLEDALHYSTANKEIFFKLNNDLDIDKTKENEEDIMKSYDKLTKFIATYLNNVYLKLNVTMNEAQKAFVLRLTANSQSIEERISKDSDLSILNLILNDFHINPSSRLIIDNKLLKIQFLTFILASCPFIYQNKTSIEKTMKALTSNDNSKRKQDDYDNMLNLAKLTKQMGLNQYDSVNVVKRVLLMHGYFKHILPFLPTRTIMVMSALVRKYKLFIYALKCEGYSFCNETNDTNFHYLFTSFLSLSIGLFLKTIRQIKGNVKYKEQTYIHDRLNDSLNNLQCYPKIYTLLTNLIRPFKLYKLVSIKSNYLTYYSISEYIHRFAQFLELNTEKMNSQGQVTELIEIGTAISLSVLLHGMKSIQLKWSSSYFTPKQTIEEEGNANADANANANDDDDDNDNKKEFPSYDKSILLLNLVTLYYSFFDEIRHTHVNSAAKEVIFSLFSSFGITLLPNISEIKLYSLYPFCLISTDSPVFWKEEDPERIFDPTEAYLFDSNHKALLITYHQAYLLLHHYAKNFINSMVRKGYKDYKYYHCPFSISSNQIKESLNNAFILYYQNKFFNCKEPASAYRLLRPFKDSFLFEESSSALSKIEKEFVKAFINDPFTFVGQMKFIDKAHQKVANQMKFKLNFVSLAITLSALPFGYENKHQCFNLTDDDEMNHHQNISSLIAQLYSEIYFLKIKQDKDAASCYRNFRLFILLLSNYFVFDFEEEIETIPPPVYTNNKGLERDKSDFGVILQLLTREKSKISPVLEIIWIKKLYPYIYMLIKKGKLEDDYHCYHYADDMTIDFELIKGEITDLTTEESKQSILKDYFELLRSFIARNLHTNNLMNTEKAGKESTNNKHPETKPQENNTEDNGASEDIINKSEVLNNIEDLIPEQYDDFSVVEMKKNDENKTNKEEEEEIEEIEEINEQEEENEEEIDEQEEEIQKEESKTEQNEMEINWIEQYYELELFTIFFSLKQAANHPNEFIKNKIAQLIDLFNATYHSLITNEHWVQTGVPITFKHKSSSQKLRLVQITQTGRKTSKSTKYTVKLKYSQQERNNYLFALEKGTQSKRGINQRLQFLEARKDRRF